MNHTQNAGYGYHGELATSAWIRRQIDEAYSNTVETLVKEGIASSTEEAIEFLDSRMGRHLGDETAGAQTLNEIYAILRAKGPAHMAQYRKACADHRSYDED